MKNIYFVLYDDFEDQKVLCGFTSLEKANAYAKIVAKVLIDDDCSEYKEENNIFDCMNIEWCNGDNIPMHVWVGYTDTTVEITPPTILYCVFCIENSNKEIVSYFVDLATANSYASNLGRSKEIMLNDCVQYNKVFDERGFIKIKIINNPDGPIEITSVYVESVNIY